MYCPNCASQATDGQRFCRQCGTNLGLIVDAIDNKREPVDFDRLKADLKDLGSSLRSGWEQAHKDIRKAKDTRRIRHMDFGDFSKAARKASLIANDAATVAVAHQREIQKQIDKVDRKIRSKMRRAEWRQTAGWHFQQAVIKILTGGAGAAVWYFLLNTAASSGLLNSIEGMIRAKQPDLTGIVPFIQMLWMLGLIPVAVGIGHLLIGAFLAIFKPPATEDSFEPPVAPHPNTSGSTKEIPPEQGFSITEDSTVPLGSSLDRTKP